MEQTVESEKEVHIQNIFKDGYTILRDVLSLEECRMIAQKLDKLAEDDVRHMTPEQFANFRDKGTVRALMSKDEYFMNLILHPKVYPLICAMVGETAIVHLQNAIIVNPNQKHTQSYFHRDFQKDFVSSKLLSINAFWIIDEFNSQTGATWVVPGTHKDPENPLNEYLEKNAVQLNERPGAVMIFDSMLIHKGGVNISNIIRRAINIQYTRPFIKQQIDLPVLLGDKYDKNSKMGQVLGYWAIAPRSVDEFRADPSKRMYRSGQG